jgi:hypothetical protein
MFVQHLEREDVGLKVFVDDGRLKARGSVLSLIMSNSLEA